MRKPIALSNEVRARLSDKLGAPWGPNDTLPLCPICGTPPMPGQHGGLLCLTKRGQLREPHAARVAAWGRELEAKARAARAN